MEEQKSRISVNDLKFWHNDLEAVIVIVLVLVVLGTINILSSSFVMAGDDYDNPYFFLQHHGFNMFVSVGLALGCTFLDYHKWGQLVPVIVGGLVVALIGVLFTEPVNGATRWINVFGLFSIQPAEFAKLFTTIIMAKFLDYRLRSGKKATYLDPKMLVFGVFIALIELEPDMGTLMIVGGVPFIMLLVVGLPKLHLWSLVTFVGVGLSGMIALKPYRLQRLAVWYDPFADAQDKGYQTVQSLVAIGSGGLFGQGLGQGISKYFYLPEAHTDFAFAIFSQENGYIMVLMVFILFTLLSLYMVRIAHSAKDLYGQLLAMGVMILIVGQAVANMMMVSGILPVIGVPLPFISYGGSSLMVSMMAIGILLNIAHQGERERVDKMRKMKAAEIAAKPKNRPQLRLVKY